MGGPAGPYPYYHIYPISSKGEDVLGNDVIMLEIPQSVARDSIVERIVTLLNDLINSDEFSATDNPDI